MIDLSVGRRGECRGKAGWRLSRKQSYADWRFSRLSDWGTHKNITMLINVKCCFPRGLPRLDRQQNAAEKPPRRCFRVCER